MDREGVSMLEAGGVRAVVRLPGVAAALITVVVVVDASLRQ